ncbi:uncharacterized protein ATNIH1004_009712 [Aspergillus tanneri]|uniref:Uncharacterized protein n=1 Tax=Aspergillus tanneri TaxID=1220188 RepID=A0A5M9MBY8_9EURO|nr:uncharacterized protein ATNIH1004_009712 [Aspergillus tanneri]KAA8642950.1 hypothetical protein ATNIH1004_009712 [Aspergillus tanneri]
MAIWEEIYICLYSLRAFRKGLSYQRSQIVKLDCLSRKCRWNPLNPNLVRPHETSTLPGPFWQRTIGNPSAEMKTPSQNLEDSMNQLTQSEPSAPSWVLPELEGSMAFDGLQEGPAMVNGCFLPPVLPIEDNSSAGLCHLLLSSPKTNWCNFP